MKLFPIKNQDASTQSNERVALTRRDLLKGSGVIVGTLAAGSALALMAPSSVWAIELQKLNKVQGETLMNMAKVLFPHSKLPDAVYAILAKDLDSDAAKNPASAQLINKGIDELNYLAGGDFNKASATRRLQAVKSMEGQNFFNMVRGKCVVSLYDNELAFKALGYPGSSWEQGGYLMRGFQDLKWLPNPPASASPAPYIG